MPIVDLYSKRQRRLRGEVSDVLSYEQIATTLRRQIFYAVTDCIGSRSECANSASVKDAYDSMVSTLRREYGVRSLVSDLRGYAYDELETFFYNANTENTLDVVEIMCRLVETVTTKHYYRYTTNYIEAAREAIEEINGRFKEHGVGYRYQNGEVIRIDNELVHAEIVKPALGFLNRAYLAGAQDEYLSAHEHYRHGNHKEALVDCLKAFESTMKAICDKHNWQRDPNATANALIKVIFDHGLIPPFWQQQFTSLRSNLECGIPTGRNKLAGHGQGSEPVEVPEHIVAYVLHMTASSILFLAKAEAELRDAE